MKHWAELVEFTPEKAADWLVREDFDPQRVRREDHVRFLRATMDKGTFDGGSSIRIVSYGKIQVMVDGQHRLDAIGMGPQTATGPTTIALMVVYTEVDTPEEAAAIYARIDRGKQRTIGDVLRVFKNEFIGHGMTPVQAGYIAAAGVIIESNFKPLPGPNDYLAAPDFPTARRQDAERLRTTTRGPVRQAAMRLAGSRLDRRSAGSVVADPRF
jgi:hypothetical protein